MRIAGYADRFSVQQGELIRFMISTEAPRDRARVVRLIHGDANPAGPGFKAEPVASTLEGEYPGQDQPIRAGSYVQIPPALPLAATGAFSLHLWLQATTPEKPRQVLFSTGADGIDLLLEAGRLTLEIAGRMVAQVERRVARHLWYRVWVTCDLARGTASLNLAPTSATATAQGGTAKVRLPAALGLPPSREVLIAAACPAAGAAARDFFNGKIDCPCVFERVLGSRTLAALAQGVAPARLAGLVAAWDSSRDIASRPSIRRSRRMPTSSRTACAAFTTATSTAPACAIRRACARSSICARSTSCRRSRSARVRRISSMPICISSIGCTTAAMPATWLPTKICIVKARRCWRAIR